MQSKLLPILLLVALVSIAIFGFLSIGTMEYGDSHKCLFAAFAGSEFCAPLQSVAAISTHYLDMIGWLFGSLASFDILVLVFSLIVFLALLLIQNLLYSRIEVPQRFILNFLPETDAFGKDTLLRWLAFHNKRDPHALARVHIPVS